MTTPNMPELAEIRGKVTNSVDVLIRATQPAINLEEPFYAINWFSTKMEWLYHFYNFLAVRSVRKIGGQPFFKARTGEVLLEEADGRRDLLLIVKYPGGQEFKALMESTYFKMVSIFRIWSVSNFTFGFTHKQAADPQSKLSDGFRHAIHHFKTPQDAKSSLEHIQLLLPSDITIKYAGYIVATLNSQTKQQAIEQIPNLMDGVIIYQSTKDHTLRAFLTSENYKAFLETLSSSYISLLNQIKV